MAVWLPDNSSYSEQVLDSEIEKDQIHRLVCDSIILLESVVGSRLQSFDIHDFFIGALSHTERREDISEHEPSELVNSVYFVVSVEIQVLEKHVKVRAERSPDTVRRRLENPLAILVVDQTVTENSDELVGPKPDSDIRIGQLLLLNQTDAANNLAHITQVKRVVRL